MTADHLVVVGRGRLIADVSVAELVARSASSVRVLSPRPAELRAVLADDGVTVTDHSDGALDVVGLSAREIGTRAAAASLTLYELSTRQASLEEAFIEATEGAVEFAGTRTTDREAA